MEHQSTEDEHLFTKDELLSRIRTSMGGRAAEIVFYGEDNGISTGASGDLKQASQIAYSMICKYGMDSSVGLCSLDDEKTITEDVRSRINSLLNEELKKAIDIIQNNRNTIDALVDALINKNKLSENEISEIIMSGSTW